MARKSVYPQVQIAPDPVVGIRSDQPPVVVFDPRAGHGPGIGGSKPTSQVGQALAVGHPCYFTSFMRSPIPGQTRSDIRWVPAGVPEDRERPAPRGEPVARFNRQLPSGLHAAALRRSAGARGTARAPCRPRSQGNHPGSRAPDRCRTGPPDRAGERCARAGPDRAWARPADRDRRDRQWLAEPAD